MAEPAAREAIPGPDGRLRCPWGLSAPEYVAYHDTEWGRPVRGDKAIFERLSLEAFQSGLSWLTILRKRENFRAAFAGFDIAAVAAFGPADEQLSDIPSQTSASKALSVGLRKHGFVFTGPVTAYATMQACGLVNDHLAGCFAR
jgi:DNA-3-methyladenine glycosylase I